MGCLTYKNALTQTFTIKGRVVDSLNFPIKDATVSLHPGKEAKTLIRLTDSAGFFQFSNVESPDFTLKVSHVNYDEFSSEYLNSSTSFNIDIGNIHMDAKIEQLGNVFVTEKRSAITVKGDTVEYNADSFAVKKGSSIEDLLKKMPGLKVERDGTIIANGKVVSKIRVNGKDFFEGNNTAVTRNLPAEIVDKVQVIDDHGEAGNFSGFDNQEAERIINIQLKKDKNNAVLVKVKVGGGTNSTYTLEAAVNYFNKDRQLSFLGTNNNINDGNIYQLISKPFVGGLGSLLSLNNSIVESLGGASAAISLIKNQDLSYLNAAPISTVGTNNTHSYGIRYSEDKFKNVSFYISALHYDVVNQLQYVSSGEEYIDDDVLNEQQNYTGKTFSSGNRIYGNIEFHPGPLFNIKLSPSVITSGKTSDYLLLRSLQLSGGAVSKGDFIDTTSSKTTNVNIDLLIKAKSINRKNSFISDVTYSYGRLNEAESGKYFFQGDSAGPTMQKPISNLVFNQINAEAIYTHFVSNKLGFECHYLLKAVGNSTIKDIYIFSDSNSHYDLLDNYSGKIRESYSLQSGILNVLYKRNKTDCLAGLEIQDLYYSANSSPKTFSYTDNFVNPFIQVKYTASKNNLLSLKYQTNIQPPSPSQVLPITDTSNPFQVVVGNIRLKSELKNKADLSYFNYDVIHGSLYLFNLSFTNTKNQIIQSVNIDSTGKTFISYINSQSAQDFSLYYNLSRPFFNKKIELVLSGTSTFGSYQFYASGLSNVSKKFFSQFADFIYYPVWGKISLEGKIETTGIEVNENIQAVMAYSIKPAFDVELDKTNFGMESNFYKRFRYLINTNDNIQLITNAYIETKLTPKLLIRFDAYDLFDYQKENVTRILDGNILRDYQYNVLGRFFLLSFVFKFNKYP